MDGEVITAARKAGAPRFRLHRLLPGPVSKQFTPEWKPKSYQRKIWIGASGARPRSARGGYDAYRNHMVEKNVKLARARERFYAVLIKSNPTGARLVWNEVADIVGGIRWEGLRPLMMRFWHLEFWRRSAEA